MISQDCISTAAVAVRTNRKLALLKSRKSILSLGPMSNFSWDDPNPNQLSNLSPPKLSKDRSLGQASKLGRVGAINWIRSVIVFSQRRLNIHHHKTFLFISLVRRMWRSTFVPEPIFRRSIRQKHTDRTCWTIQTLSEFDVWPRPYYTNKRQRWMHGKKNISL